MIQRNTEFPQADEIKAQAIGREIDLLIQAGFPPEYLDGKGHPCPLCGQGKDCFALRSRERGAVGCRKCFPDKNGDFLSAIQRKLNLSFPETCRWAAERLGMIEGEPFTPPAVKYSAPAVSTSSGAADKPAHKPKGKAFATADEAVRNYERNDGKHSAQWEYHNAKGEVVCIEVRWNYGPGEKVYKRVSKFDTGWHCDDLPQPRPLYRLPKLRGANRVYICEGAKAATAAAKIGLHSTAALNGAVSPHCSDWTPLSGKEEAIILADNDKVGEKFATKVTQLLSILEKPPAVTVLLLPGLPPKGDIVEWIEAQGDQVEDAELIRRIETLVAEAKQKAIDDAPKYGLIVTRLCDVEEVAVEWLWPGRIPLGGITTIVGYGGEGKSFLSCAIGTSVSQGWKFEGNLPCPKGSVVILAGEDLPARLKSRYRVNGADLNKISIIEGQIQFDGRKAVETSVSLHDIELIRHEVAKIGDVKLVIVDPIGSFIPDINSDKDNEVRKLLAPLAKMANDHNLAAVIICHRRKGGDSRADNAALGSVAFTAAARAVHHLILDPTSDAPKKERRRLFLPGKINDAEEAQGLAFWIRPPEGLIEWQRDAIEMTADDAMQLASEKANGKKGPKSVKQAKAEEWLKNALKDGSWKSAKDLIEGAEEAGHAERTLRDAKDALGVTHKKRGFGGGVDWQLPHCEILSADMGDQAEVGLV